MMPYSLIVGDLCFGGTWCTHNYGDRRKLPRKLEEEKNCIKFWDWKLGTYIYEFLQVLVIYLEKLYYFFEGGEVVRAHLH